MPGPGAGPHRRDHRGRSLNRVAGPTGPTRARAPGSVRRTSSLDATWPSGRSGPTRVEGRARDLRTRPDGTAEVLGEDTVLLDLLADRTLRHAQSPRVDLCALDGVRGGGGLRARVADSLPDERAGGTPLFLLLDDLAGMSLVAGFAWSQWPDPDVQPLRRTARRMEGVCAGFRPGASSLDDEGRALFSHDLRAVPPLPSVEDPQGWHPLPEPLGVSMRRARRIDVRVDDVVRVDAMFQDSCTVPAGGRLAVHEYQLTATADPRTGVLLSVAADPRVLPYAECPLAAGNVDRLVGTPLRELREVVLTALTGTAGCTHLNDALRALAEVPLLLG